MNLRATQHEVSKTSATAEDLAYSMCWHAYRFNQAQALLSDYFEKRELGIRKEEFHGQDDMMRRSKKDLTKFKDDSLAKFKEKVFFKIRDEQDFDELCISLIERFSLDPNNKKVFSDQERQKFLWT